MPKQSLRERFQAALLAHQMNAPQAAAYIGELAPSTIWNWLAGAPPAICL